MALMLLIDTSFAAVLPQAASTVPAAYAASPGAE